MTGTWAVEIPKYAHEWSHFTRVYREYGSQEEAEAEADRLRATGRHRFVVVTYRPNP